MKNDLKLRTCSQELYLNESTSTRKNLFVFQMLHFILFKEAMILVSISFPLIFLETNTIICAFWISLLFLNTAFSALYLMKFQSSNHYKIALFFLRLLSFVAFNLMSALAKNSLLVDNNNYTSDFGQSIRSLYSLLLGQGVCYMYLENFKIAFVISQIIVTISSLMLIHALVLGHMLSFYVPEYLLILLFNILSFKVCKSCVESSKSILTISDHFDFLLSKMPASFLALTDIKVQADINSNKMSFEDEDNSKRYIEDQTMNIQHMRGSRVLNSLQSAGINAQKNLLLSKLKLMANIDTGQSLIYMILSLKSTNSDNKDFVMLGLFLEDKEKSESDNVFSVIGRYIKNPCDNCFCFEIIIQSVQGMNYSIQNERTRESLASVAHEFKTPIICTSLLAETVKDNLLKNNIGEAIKSAEDLQRVSDYVFFLIDDIMQSTKKGMDRKNTIAINAEEKSPEEDLLFVYEILQVLLKIKNGKNNVITPIFDLSEEVLRCRINTDSVRLRQILLNFVSNSTKFTKSGSIGVIAYIDNNNNLLIEIRDTGIGMTSEVVNKINKGHKIIDVGLNREMNKYGTGTGLTVVQTLAELLSYRIELESAQFCGTSFKLIIPTVSINNRIENEEDLLDIKKQNSSTAVKIRQSAARLPTISSNESKDSDNPSDTDGSLYRMSELSMTIALDNQICNESTGIKEDKTEKLDSKILGASNIRPMNTKLLPKNSGNLARNSKLFFLRLSVLSSKQRHNTVIPDVLNNFLPMLKYSKIKPQIVVCDDCELIRNSLIKMLRDLTLIKNTYEVITCYDGAEVLMKLIQDQTNGNLIKLIMIDENMDYLSGTQTVSIINRLELDGKVKKVFCVSISANDGISDPKSVYHAIITKPLTKLKLREFFQAFNST